MEAKDLSKCKYIYRVYVAKDGITHMEKYPVIYANKAFIYFRDIKSAELNRVGLRYVLTRDPITNNLKIDESVSAISPISPYSRIPVDLYIWDENGIDMDEVNHIYEQIKANYNKRLIDQKIKYVNTLKERYERELKELERLTKEMEG